MNIYEKPTSSIHLIPIHNEEHASSSSVGGSHMSTSEPLLSGTNGGEDREQSNWIGIPFFDSRSRRRKDSTLAFEDKMPHRRKLGSRRCMIIGLGLLVVLGVYQLITLLGYLMILFVPDRIHSILGQWGQPGHIGANLAHWPTDFSRDVLPIPCHSHNDYWRDVPLYSAIAAGCIGVEADIWLFAEELYVGHSIESLTPNRTLDSLYINPLLDILSKQNPTPQIMPDPDQGLHGVFDTTPSQPLILLIDFKTAGDALWPYMYAALEPLRQKGYLTHVNNSSIIQRAITVVGTGNTPFDKVDSNETNPNHDVFFDAPLDVMHETFPNTENDQQTANPPLHNSRSPLEKRVSDYNPRNAYYASAALETAIGPLENGAFSPTQLSLLRAQIRGAHAHGLKARYWELPFWPINLRNHVWDVLVREGVDLLNVDDLKGATKRNWSVHRGWWRRGKGVIKGDGMEEGEG